MENHSTHFGMILPVLKIQALKVALVDSGPWDLYFQQESNPCLCVQLLLHGFPSNSQTSIPEDEFASAQAQMFERVFFKLSVLDLGTALTLPRPLAGKTLWEFSRLIKGQYQHTQEILV